MMGRGGLEWALGGWGFNGEDEMGMGNRGWG